MLADIFAFPMPAASFIPFRDSSLGRVSRITPLDLIGTSLPDDNASSVAPYCSHIYVLYLAPLSPDTGLSRGGVIIDS
jgi:hypothetical protein